MVAPRPRGPQGRPLSKALHTTEEAGGIGLALARVMKARKTAVKSRKAVGIAPTDVLEVLDRVLDRGIVIDAWLRVSVAGLALVDVDVRIVVASIRTYLTDADAVAGQGTVARPASTVAAAKRPVPAAVRAPARARARRPRQPAAKAMFRCPSGCTFLRSVRRASPVRCPSDASRRCAVTAIAA
jgi:gas vesicle structural protein